MKRDSASAYVHMSRVTPPPPPPPPLYAALRILDELPISPPVAYALN